MVEYCVEIVWESLVLFGGEARRELYGYRHCGELQRQDIPGINEQEGSPQGGELK
jgi:hypothetical protein